MNVENCRKVLDQIETHPETWNQKEWHCGTTHCFAGWAQKLFFKREDVNKVRVDARIALQLNYREAQYLFCTDRTLAQIQAFVAGIDGYDPDGYDRDGYNRSGYDRDGYDRDGYNRDGYNRDGYHRNGYNRDGYDRDGYDRDGYNRDGYDRDGYDRDGINIRFQIKGGV